MPENEVIVITGASAGIGRAAARAFAAPGARIALLARGEHGLASAKREVEAAGAQALAIPTDVSSYEQLERATQQIVEKWRHIDVWVNNAMATLVGPIGKVSPEELKRVTEVTYLGAAYGTMIALKYMQPRNRGVIVQVGSALAYRAIPLQAPYCAAKHALRGFTDSLRSELIHDGSRIHLTHVHLSAFNTPQFDWARNLTRNRPQPVPPIFQPELAAQAIVWAARHRRREVFVGFPAWKAVIANKVAPGWLDRILAKGAYEGQLTDEPVQQDACENLMKPCDVDAGARGRFDQRAKSYSAQWWFTRNRPSIVTAAVLAGLVAILAARKGE